MKVSLIGLLFLLVVCIALPFLFTWVEGLEYSTKELDEAGYSRTMDPAEDIVTLKETGMKGKNIQNLPDNFFDSVRQGPYYSMDDGIGSDGKEEDDSKYLSGKHKIVDATGTPTTYSSRYNRLAGQNIDTAEDITALQERYKGDTATVDALTWLRNKLKVREAFTVVSDATRINQKNAMADAAKEERIAITNLETRTTELTAAETAITSAPASTLAADMDKLRTAKSAAEERKKTAENDLIKRSTDLAKLRNDYIQAEDRALETAISAQKIALEQQAAAQTAYDSAPEAEKEAKKTELNTKKAAAIAAIKATNQARLDQAKARITAGMNPLTRQVVDASDNLIWDISNNNSLYNANGVLSLAPYVSAAELKEVQKGYTELAEKCNKGLKCVADFKTKIGENLCCGQTGVLQDTSYVCPAEYPTCQSFKCGSKFGTCV
jgi:hypothetical protein